MINSPEASQSQPDQSPDLSSPILPVSEKDQQDYFDFLEPDKEGNAKLPSFFSKNGLGQDIIQVTEAEPDICLEAFHALFNVLRPQIEKQSRTPLKDAWKNFLGGSITKGILCPPEKLISKRLNDIKKVFSEIGEENDVFEDLDRVVNFILDLEKKLADYDGEILQKKDIMTSLSLIREFYAEFKTKVKDLIHEILEKERTDTSSASQYHELTDLLEPKAIMMSDIFYHHWAYRISRSKAQKLLSLDEKERSVQSNLADHSTHRVAALPERGEAPEPLVYFKANGNHPLQPEKEFMLYSLYRHLNIPVPETALLILTNVFPENSDYYYAVQASEAVSGKAALQACQDKETVFEEEAYVLQVIGALLTSPSDGSLKNFKYSPIYKTLISIDNDLIFGPELIGEESKIVNVKSLLYLLPEMDKPSPASIQTYFTTLDPQSMILTWLHDLEKKNKEYQLLFSRLSYQYARLKYQNLRPQTEAPSLTALIQEKIRVDPDIHQSSFYPQIRLSENLVNNITKKLQKIESKFLNNYSASPQILFQEISPILGYYYKKLRFQLEDPKEALEALWGENQGTTKYPYIDSLLNAEEVNTLMKNKDVLENEKEEETPEKLFEEYKKILASEKASLDKLIKRHRERKMKNVLDLQQVLKDLQMLIQEGLTDSKSFRDVVDFWHDLSNISGDDKIIEEIRSLLFNLPHSEIHWLFTLEKYFLRIENPDLDQPFPTVHGAFLRKRVFNLTESEKSYLFDIKGDLQKNPSLTGRSKVTCFPEKEPEFYLKQYPEWPGYEFASTLLMRLLGITHLPYQDLLIMKSSSSSRYPVLLTQKVEGKPVVKIWNETDAFRNLDPYHTGLLIISAMLLNPEDGKEDNYILSTDGRFLIPIDNDHCFLPSTFQEDGKFWKPWTVNTALQTKTLLFCLDEMDSPIPKEVSDHIISLNFDSLLTSWMKELIKVEDRYNNLVDHELKNDFLGHGTVFRIPFYEQFIHNLYWKVHKIQDLLRSSPNMSPFDLLQALEPFAAGWYRDSSKKGNTVEKRFKAATGQLYTKTNPIDGSRVSIMSTRSMMSIIHISEADLKNDLAYNKMGPPDAEELLRQLIEERSKKRKMEEEFLRELDKDEESIWNSLFGNRLSEESLKEFFKNPQESLALKGSKLILSTRLTSLFALSSDKGAKIRFLSLPESPLLNNTTIRTLVEGCPSLEYLNVSGCIKLNEIVTAKGEWPLMARIEAKECPILERLVCYSPIRVVRIGTLRNVEICVEEPSVDVFEISMGSSQFDLSFRKDQGLGIRSIERSSKGSVGDQGLGVYFKDLKMKIGKYSISSKDELRALVSFADLKPCEIHPQILEEILQLNLMNIKKLALSDSPSNKLNLASTSFSGFFATNPPNENFTLKEKVSILALGKWPLLEELNLSNTRIADIEILAILIKANWPRLRSINLSNSPVSDEGLAVLSQGRWLLLETLDLSSTAVTIAGVWEVLFHARWINLKEIIFTPANLTQHEKVSHLFPSSLETIDLKNLDIGPFEIGEVISRSKWFKLKHLDLSRNPISDAGLAALPQGEWPLLETLNLSYTNVSTKGVVHLLLQVNWPNLKEIIFVPSDKIDHDQINHLLPTNKTPRLITLDLSKTKLTSKAIKTIVQKSICLSLKHLNLSHNDISDEGFSILALGEWPLLEEVHLQQTKITQKSIEAIVKKSKWPQLKHLNICDNQISEYGFRVLSHGKWPLLEQLRMQKTGITSKGIEVIVNQSEWLKLKNLDLSFNSLTNREMPILSQGNWPLLETLHLKNTHVTEKGVLYLFLLMNWPHLKSVISHFREHFPVNLPLLERLDLMNTETTDMSIAAILSKCPRLKFLNLSDNDVSDGRFSISAIRELPVLEELYLKNTNMKFERIEFLVQGLKLPQLKSLNISKNAITEKGFEMLSLGEWPLLEELSIWSTNLTPKGIESIVDQSQWPKLKKLDVSGNKILDEGLEILASGKWPMMESLIFHDTEITAEGFLLFLERINWPNIKRLKNFSLEKLLKNVDEATSKIVQTKIALRSPTSDQRFTQIVLNASWSAVENICISVNEQDESEKPTILLPIEKWNQLEYLNVSLPLLPNETIIWPSNLKTLDISRNYLDSRTLQTLFSIAFTQLEELNLRDTRIKAQEVKMIVNLLSKLPTLKKLKIADNPFSDEGLAIIASGKWPLLKYLDVHNTCVTEKGVGEMIIKADWPNLEILDFSMNRIISEEIEDFITGKWPLLKKVFLDSPKILDF